MDTVWRVCLSDIQEMDNDPYMTVEWQPVKCTGTGMGKISHHSAIVVSNSKVLFYGGLLGEDSNEKVYVLDLNRHHWSTVPLKVSHLAT